MVKGPQLPGVDDYGKRPRFTFIPKNFSTAKEPPGKATHFDRSNMSMIINFADIRVQAFIRAPCIPEDRTSFRHQITCAR